MTGCHRLRLVIVTFSSRGFRPCGSFWLGMVGIDREGLTEGRR